MDAALRRFSRRERTTSVDSHRGMMAKNYTLAVTGHRKSGDAWRRSSMPVFCSTAPHTPRAPLVCLLSPSAAEQRPARCRPRAG